MILLEYHPKQGFHNNTCIPEQNKFSSVLFSNGWKPVWAFLHLNSNYIALCYNVYE